MMSQDSLLLRPNVKCDKRYPRWRLFQGRVLQQYLLYSDFQELKSCKFCSISPVSFIQTDSGPRNLSIVRCRDG